MLAMMIVRRELSEDFQKNSNDGASLRKKHAVEPATKEFGHWKNDVGRMLRDDLRIIHGHPVLISYLPKSCVT